MSELEYIWSCLCGAETECTREDQECGAVFQCPGCRKVYGRVTPRRGGRAWVEIKPSEVTFYRLLDKPEEDNE